MKLRTFTVTEVHPGRVVAVDSERKSYDFYYPGLSVGSTITIQTDSEDERKSS